MATTKQKETIRSFYKQRYNKTFSDAELEEIQLSLFFLGRAIHRYQLIQKGVIKREK